MGSEVIVGSGAVMDTLSSSLLSSTKYRVIGMRLDGAFHCSVAVRAVGFTVTTGVPGTPVRVCVCVVGGGGEKM